MNKYKKLAIAAVSLVMAGSMAFSMAACGGNSDTPVGPNVNATDKADEWNVLNDDGTLNYGAYARESAVTLNLGIGHNSLETSTSFRKLSAQIPLPDGVTYQDGDMKPAWAQMGKDLNITFNDVYQGKETSKNLTEMLTTNDTDGATWYSKTDMFTTDLSVAVSQAAAQTPILNLADYLNYMPNFTAFLENNPVVYLSLLQYGMSTSDGSGKVIYVAPYFDGYDDIERYCIIRHDWAKKILNGDADLAGSTAWGKATSVQPYFTEGYEVESLTADGAGKQTIKKDFKAAASAVKKADSDLGKAYAAITGNNTYSGSGNIVDIMNKAIAANQNATGDQLAKLFRAYIDVAYKGVYAKDSRANLFIGYDAAWDVDDLVAMLRCVVTNASALGATGGVAGILPRDGTTDRTPDLVSLAAQLYGARGATSRFENTYIDASGTLQDARNDKQFYQAMLNLNLLKQEGLVVDFPTSYKGAAGLNGTTQNFMMYDYSQTQTLNGFYVEDATIEGAPAGLPAGFDFEPILTPVAKWDVNGNGKYGEKNEIFRFTESWRSTKTGGLCLNGSLANPGNEDKLKAALQFVDYLYHSDGQIVSTFGPMASDANGTGGFWYNQKATDEQVAAGQYFTYKGEKYAGYNYKGEYTPTITTALYDSFKGKAVNGFKITSNEAISKGKLSFTDYARRIIGSTLPVAVKDQSFENQLTSQMGQNGANRVGAALAAGVVKGMSLNINSNNYWYTAVPSALPVQSAIQTGTLDDNSQNDLKYLSGTRRSGQDKNMYSIFAWIILHGLDGTAYNYQDVTYTVTSVDQVLDDMSNAKGAQRRETALNSGWTNAKSYWEYLDPTKA